MAHIKIMDCTLRDGGYVNDWRFGRRCMEQTAKKLCQASIDYIECGFLSQTKTASAEQSVFRTIEEVNIVFAGCAKNIALMVNCGEYNPREISEYDGGITSLIRIAFHKHQIEEAQTLCMALKEKGYRVFFQPMATLSYTDTELLSLIEWANRNKPEAFYMVDSFGAMRKSDVLRMFYLIDNNLSEEIKVGFHSHNNLQLSFSNAQELMLMHTKRDIIIDSSVFGMGRGAGNLCTELLTQYVNENIENKYDLIPILEIMDEYIMPIYTNKPWGYSAPYYIAAINGCHPNYATYLMNRQTLCIRDINTIIRRIPSDQKQLYHPELIADMYLDYQKHTIDDSEVLDKLSRLCHGREVLLLAPGKSLATCVNDISDYIARHNPVIFSINHIPEKYPYDIVFISNLKRFKGIDDAAARIGEKLICTSNISGDNKINTVNYTSYLNDDDVISDNAGLMLINVLKKIGISKIALAGYDGFDTVGTDNYYDGKLNLNVHYKNRMDMNLAMKKYFENLRKSMEVNFVTPSIYKEKLTSTAISCERIEKSTGKENGTMKTKNNYGNIGWGGGVQL